MKTVKSIADATRMAAQSGATLEVGGRTINSGGAKMAVVRAAPEPAPPAPEPAKPDPLDRVADIVAAQARLSAAQGDAMNRMVAEVMDKIQPERPARRPLLRMDVVRDERGLITQLIPVFENAPGELPGA